jgi:hypothetical protein
MAKKQNTNDQATNDPAGRPPVGDRPPEGGEGRKRYGMAASGTVAARGASATARAVRPAARGARPAGDADGGAAVEAGGGTATMAGPDTTVAPVEEVGAGTWQANKRITAMWGSAESRDTWVFVAGTGWRKLSTHSLSASVALTTLAAHGQLTRCRVDYREQADGTISELYVW